MSDELFEYATRWSPTFTEVWEDATTFSLDLKSSPIFEREYLPGYTGTISFTDDDISLIYYLLYANFGNSSIASNDEMRFKQKLFATIWQYGKAWKIKLEIQDKIRNLSEDEITTGTKAIYNTALNPQTEPTTGSLEELTYINSQNTTGYKKSKLDAYSAQWDLIATDVTKAFMDQFKKLFIIVVSPKAPILYESEE